MKKIFATQREKFARYWYFKVGYRTFSYRNMSGAANVATPTIRKRLLIDVSVICNNDAGTGIQRVVRSIATEIYSLHDRNNINISFVYHARGKYFFADVRNDNYHKTLRECIFYVGDCFFGLDFSLDTVWRSRQYFKKLKRMGVSFWFLMHDVLPLSHPHLFSRATSVRFFNWLSVTATLADGFFCVSSSTEKALRAAIRSKFKAPLHFAVRVIPMGWDLSSSCRSLPTPPRFASFLSEIARCPTILMVGTIEPRKRHSEVLAAMELLWKMDKRYNLILVGVPGWKTAELQTRLDTHPETGRRLFWLRQISDGALTDLYKACCGVVMASEAEGFGLPLIEAIGHGKPVLARDIPPFREHAHRGVTFFPANAAPHEMAGSIDAWIKQTSSAPENFAHTLSSWKDSAAFICKHFLSTGQIAPERSR